jgi:hypothetical protein
MKKCGKIKRYSREKFAFLALKNGFRGVFGGQK